MSARSTLTVSVVSESFGSVTGMSSVDVAFLFEPVNIAEPTCVAPSHRDTLTRSLDDDEAVFVSDSPTL